MAALDRMVAENIHDRGKEVTKPPAVDIAIPWQVKASLKKPCGKKVHLFVYFFLSRSSIIILD